MKTKLVQIGNSQGVRIPKTFIERAKLRGGVEMVIHGDEIVIRSSKHPRAGWDDAFATAIKKHGNELTAEDREWLDAPLLNDSDMPPW